MENFLPKVAGFSELFSSLDFSFTPSFFQAAVIVVTVFLLALTLGLARHHMIMWSLKGIHFGFIIGIIFILSLEIILLLGGRTAIFETTASKNLPPSLRVYLDEGRKEIARVLGFSVEKIPESEAQEKTTPESIIKDFGNLAPSDAQTARWAICKPQN